MEGGRAGVLARQGPLCSWPLWDHPPSLPGSSDVFYGRFLFNPVFIIVVHRRVCQHKLFPYWGDWSLRFNSKGRWSADSIRVLTKTGHLDVQPSQPRSALGSGPSSLKRSQLQSRGRSSVSHGDLCEDEANRCIPQTVDLCQLTPPSKEAPHKLIEAQLKEQMCRELMTRIWLWRLHEGLNTWCSGRCACIGVTSTSLQISKKAGE